MADKLFFDDQQIKIRFRNSFFPFTEPSCEVDLSCIKCKEEIMQDCKLCSGSG